MSDDKHVDESWKNSVSKDKADEGCGCDSGCGCSSQKDEHEHGEGCGCDSGHDHGVPEVNFLNYLMSMGYQTMIFLGEVPHPATGETQKNVAQAKFLIDTLVMLRDKTKGNLLPQEEQFLSSTLYELQLKYVEVAKKESSGIIS